MEHGPRSLVTVCVCVESAANFHEFPRNNVFFTYRTVIDWGQLFSRESLHRRSNTYLENKKPCSTNFACVEDGNKLVDRTV